MWCVSNVCLRRCFLAEAEERLPVIVVVICIYMLHIDSLIIFILSFSEL